MSNIILSKQIVDNSKKQEVKEGGGKILIIMDKTNTKSESQLSLFKSSIILTSKNNFKL